MGTTNKQLDVGLERKAFLQPQALLSQREDSVEVPGEHDKDAWKVSHDLLERQRRPLGYQGRAYR